MKCDVMVSEANHLMANRIVRNEKLHFVQHDNVYHGGISKVLLLEFQRNSRVETRHCKALGMGYFAGKAAAAAFVPVAGGFSRPAGPPGT
jgi:hypothetical protein